MPLTLQGSVKGSGFRERVYEVQKGERLTSKEQGGVVPKPRNTFALSFANLLLLGLAAYL